MVKQRLVTLLIGLCLTGGAPAFGQSSGALDLQLNNAVSHDGVCRLSFLVRNGLDVALKDLGLEIVLLDKDGLARNFMMLRTGELIRGKRRVRQFDLPDVDCATIGEVLVNDVADCQGDGLTSASCLAALKPSSKTAIKLGL